MIRFLADENIPLEAVNSLKKEGIEIESISVIKPGIDDEEILEMANRENKVIITFDSDFGKFVFKDLNESKGVIFLRILPASVETITNTIKSVLSLNINFYSSFCVVDANNVRVVPINRGF